VAEGSGPAVKGIADLLHAQLRVLQAMEQQQQNQLLQQQLFQQQHLSALRSPTQVADPRSPFPAAPLSPAAIASGAFHFLLPLPADDALLSLNADGSDYVAACRTKPVSAHLQQQQQQQQQQQKAASTSDELDLSSTPTTTVFLVVSIWWAKPPLLS
jgi:hypothetical protein